MEGFSGTTVSGVFSIEGTIPTGTVATSGAALPLLPTFPVPTLEGAKAGRRLHLVTRAFLCRLRKYKSVIEWIEATTAERLEQERDELALLSEQAAEKRRKLVRKQVRHAAVKRFGKKWLKPPRMQIAASAGTGKTSNIAKLYRENPWMWLYRIWYFAPTISLCKEFVDRINTNAPPGMPLARVLPGRTYSEDQEPPCLRAEIVKEAQSKVQSVHKSFCNHGDGFLCDHYDYCKYIQARKDETPGILAFAHASMVTSQPGELTLPPPDLVIVDEASLPAFVRHTKVHLDSLGLVDTYVRDGDTDEDSALAAEYAAAGARIANLVMSDPGYLAQLGALGVTSDVLRAMAKAADRPMTSPAIFPNDRDDNVRRKLCELAPNPGRSVAVLLRQIAWDLDAERNTSIAVEAIVEAPEARGGRKQGEFSPYILVHGLKKPAFSKNVPLLIIDADAIAEFNDRIFPGPGGSKLRVVDIRAVRLGTVVQCCNATFPKSHFTAYGWSGDFDRGQRSLESIGEFALAHAATGKKVLVVMNKPMRIMLTGESQGALPPYFALADGVEVTHFGRFVGQDRWRNFDVVIVVGREEPPAPQIEQIARALYGKTHGVQLGLPGDYIRAVRKYAEGAPEFAEISIHPDLKVHNVLELFRERQSCQAIDRVRLIHKDERQVEVYILCNIPLPGIVSPKLVSAKDLLSGGPRVERAFARGVFTTNAKVLAGLYSDLWRTPKAAEHDLARWKAKTPETHSNSLYAKWGLLKSAEVRIDRAKRWSPIWYDPTRIPYLMDFIRQSVSPNQPTTIELRHRSVPAVASDVSRETCPHPQDVGPVLIRVSFTLPRVIASGSGLVEGARSLNDEAYRTA